MVSLLEDQNRLACMGFYHVCFEAVLDGFSTPTRTAADTSRRVMNTEEAKDMFVVTLHFVKN